MRRKLKADDDIIKIYDNELQRGQVYGGYSALKSRQIKNEVLEGGVESLKVSKTTRVSFAVTTSSGQGFSAEHPNKRRKSHIGGPAAETTVPNQDLTYPPTSEKSVRKLFQATSSVFVAELQIPPTTTYYKTTLKKTRAPVSAATASKRPSPVQTATLRI